MTNTQLHAFDSLVAAWLAHQDLRTTDASIAERASSRSRLDDARLVARIAS